MWNVNEVPSDVQNSKGPWSVDKTCARMNGLLEQNQVLNGTGLGFHKTFAMGAVKQMTFTPPDT